MRPPTPIVYHGGKSWTAPWIVPQIPPHDIYVEPFCGILSILLAKPPARDELVNDSNHWLVNWWLCVRDRADELVTLTRNTPNSRILYQEACARVAQAGDRKASGIQDAFDFQVIIQQSIMHGWGRPNSWALKWKARSPYQIADRIQIAKDRLQNVQIECTDGARLIKRCQDPNTLIYCDPPYPSSDTSIYGQFQVDADKLAQALLDSPCKVMISGYPGDWDHLGWRMETKRTCRISHAKVKKPDALYCNFDPPQGGLFR